LLILPKKIILLVGVVFICFEPFPLPNLNQSFLSGEQESQMHIYKHFICAIPGGTFLATAQD
jgi:hypothetical protein